MSAGFGWKHGAAAAVVAVACAGPADSGDPAPPACTDCALTDADNYTYSASLSADVVPVAAGQDVRVSWDGLDHDVHGHARGERFEVTQALLVAFGDLSPDEVLDKLASDALQQAAIALYASCTPTDDGCDLSDFNVFGRTFELEQYFTQGSGTWLVILTSSSEPGGHAFVFLEPRDDSAARGVAVTDATSAIDVSVDLADRPPVPIVVDGASTLSWDAVTVDGLGNPLAAHQLDRLVVGAYPDLGLAELEGRVFDLEALADPLWEADIAGRTSISLGELADAADLEGLRSAEASLVALYCSSCLNPAPKIVAPFDPRPPAP